MILPPHFQTINISIFKWLLIWVYCSHFPDNLFYLIQTHPWIYFPCHTVQHDFHWGLVHSGWWNMTAVGEQTPALKCQAPSAWRCWCYLGRFGLGWVTRFKWYRNIFKGCFNDCWQKVTQSVNGRSCSWMWNNTSFFLVAMALLHGLVSAWEGEGLVLHPNTLHPPINCTVRLGWQCRDVPCKIRTRFQ